MAGSKSNPIENVHDDSHLRLHEADEKNRQQVEELRERLQKELRSSRRNFWVAVINTGAVLAGVVGAGWWAHDFRVDFKEFATTISAKVETTNEKIGALELRTALMQKDLSPVQALETRVRELERELDRIKGGDRK